MDERHSIAVAWPLAFFSLLSSFRSRLMLMRKAPFTCVVLHGWASSSISNSVRTTTRQFDILDSMAKHSSHILELAKRGAEARYRELKAELTALEKLFSHLRYGAAVSPAMPDEAGASPVRRRRRKMSAAAKKAASVRMKKYWAGKRKATKA